MSLELQLSLFLMSLSWILGWILDILIILKQLLESVKILLHKNGQQIGSNCPETIFFLSSIFISLIFEMSVFLIIEIILIILFWSASDLFLSTESITSVLITFKELFLIESFCFFWHFLYLEGNVMMHIPQCLQVIWLLYYFIIPLFIFLLLLLNIKFRLSKSCLIHHKKILFEKSDLENIDITKLPR